MGASMQPMQAAAVAGASASGPLVVWFEDCRKESVPLVGGKCSSLGELIHAGVRVPPGFALTTAGFRRFMADAGIAREVASILAGIDMQDLDALEAASQRIRAMIETHDFARDIEDEVAECYRKLSLRCGLPAAPVAVRSSATAEDLEDASFAGQQDTYLWVRGIDEVLHHMRKCISSLYTARAIDYRLKHGFDDEQLAISVGVQKMANAYTAGVMFTIHPANGDRSVIVIDSNFGFGESVVSGEVTPDNFVVNKVTLDIIDRTISQKLVCVTVDRKTQTSQTTDVPLERQRVQSLIDDEITEL
ncbi:MAG: phenylphosphate synthase subunit beta, partial [Burkholderiaceae bacterium]|nr:phenylphosphate synthase subunit beta [Burkholderiaceae bacterium]